MPSEPTEEFDSPLSDRFVIDRQLGAGAMGVVFRAYDRRRDTAVALKMLRVIDAAAIHDLKREFRALADISHPNLVTLHELVSNGYQSFIAMELVEGVNFLAYVRGEDPAFTPGLDFGRLRSALRQLAEGLSALHAAGKLHRDLKPSNVLVNMADRRVVLVDFGLVADDQGDQTRQSFESGIVGTPAYMSPEQVAGKPATTASDWYSVGVMLYEALTGRLPFEGNLAEILHAKLNRQPPRPAEVKPHVPEDLSELCTALMSPSPEARPSEQELLRRLHAEDFAPVLSAATAEKLASSQTFVGRAAELDVLREAYTAIRHGQPATVYVKGASGIGKTALVRHFVDLLRRSQDAVILEARCYERESVPYKALDNVVDELVRYLRNLPGADAEALIPRDIQALARTFPALERVPAVATAPRRHFEAAPPQEIRHRAFNALKEFLARIADRRPLVVVVDDLHWGDEDSGALMAQLLGPPDPPAMLFVASYRSTEEATSPFLSALRKWQSPSQVIREVMVEPLSPAETCQLALALLEGEDAEATPLAERLARESEGIPFFLGELVRFSRERADCEVGLGEVIGARISQLSSGARSLLEVLAIAGAPIDQTVATRTIEPGQDEGTALHALRAARLVRTWGVGDLEKIEIYHARVREAVIARLSSEQLRTCHRALAIALETTGRADSFKLALHFDAAEDRDRALPHALQAAEVARKRNALEAAAKYFEIAERAEGADRATRQRIAEGFGDVLNLRGLYGDAIRQLEKARALVEQATDLSAAESNIARARIEGKLGELAFKRGDMMTASLAVERALALLGEHVPRTMPAFALAIVWQVLVQSLHTRLPRWFLAYRGEAGEQDRLTMYLYARLTYCYWFYKGRIPSLWAHLRGMNFGEAFVETLELAQILSSHGPVMTLIPLYDRAVRYVDKSLAIRKRFNDLWGQGQSLHFLGVVYYCASRFQECRDACSEAIQHLDRTGDRWERNDAALNLALALLRQGELKAAVEISERTYKQALEIGDNHSTGISLEIWSKATGGRVPAELLATELERSSEHDVQTYTEAMQGEGVRLLYDDRTVEAIAVFEDAQARVRKAGLQMEYVAAIPAWLATALRRRVQQVPLGAPERPALLKRARKAARQAMRLARKFRNNLPHALRELGMLDAMSGPGWRARKLLERSLSVAQQQGARYEHAQTLLARGQLGLTLGWPGAAEDVAAAMQALRALGADFALGIRPISQE
jgi:tetratricopeptide (TPR) repeat protein